MNERPVLPTHSARNGKAASHEAVRKHVLIVDDHDASRTVYAGYCDLFDHVAETAHSREEAVAALGRRRFDVVVVNVHMDEDGAATVAAIRSALAEGASPPIIGLAAAHRADEAQRWTAAGLAALIAKPVTAARFFAAIGSALPQSIDSARTWKPAV